MVASAEPAPAARVLVQRGRELVAAEVGPERVREHELGVGDLEEQEVRDAVLAGAADHEVGIGQPRLVQPCAQRLLVDVVGRHAVAHEPSRGLDELVPAAVVEADVQVERLVRGRRVLEPLHLGCERRREPVATADEAHAHALRREVLELAVDRLGEQVEQVGDLVGRPRPVLGRERVHGERAHAEIDRRLDGAAQCTRAGAVPREHGQPATAGPAAVAVHDQRHVRRDLGQARLLVARRADEQPDSILQAWHRRRLSGLRSDLEDLGFLVLVQLVDDLDVLVGQLLHAILGAVQVVRRRPCRRARAPSAA